MYFDSHAHLEDSQFDKDRQELITKAKKEGVEWIVDPGSDLPSSKAAVTLAQNHDFIYAAVGIHPQEAWDITQDTYNALEQLTQNPKVVAIGEIGLDYHYQENPPREVQIEVFEQQIQMASRLKLPIIVHNREAHGDTFEILKKNFNQNSGGVMHSYSGSVEMAKKFIELGLYLSISGPVTFKNAKKNVEVVREIPLEYLLIETDSPYLTPVPFRGKKNHPSMVKYVAQKIADIKNISVEQVAKITKENAMKLFRIY
ncbi:TatD family hydrolase [Garciella nitratireducens]|uniref:TatD DNase family protein n=1 Tax=Garciella nitratireducens DSM 15102 TaxID=1121911 RepID=A0A1T4MEJ5_9FIRM|nr:TatD family hydrolase [Garciella nitratireducens]RBP39892.1 TatD DNase family protein [Garciella nitratireducens]SJZ65362.1 TatD DNase family protein [Garciella nitratireducens DSM 15102]